MPFWFHERRIKNWIFNNNLFHLAVYQRASVISRFMVILAWRGIGVKKNFFGGVWVPAYNIQGFGQAGQGIGGIFLD